MLYGPAVAPTNANIHAVTPGPSCHPLLALLSETGYLNEITSTRVAKHTHSLTLAHKGNHIQAVGQRGPVTGCGQALTANVCDGCGPCGQ